PMATGPGDKTLLTELSDALRRLDLRGGPGCAQPAAERVQVFPGGAGEAARELVMKMLPHTQVSFPQGREPVFQKPACVARWVPATGSPRRKRRGGPLTGTTMRVWVDP